MSLLKNIFGEQDSWTGDVARFKEVFDYVVFDSQRIVRNAVDHQNTIFTEAKAEMALISTPSAEGYFAFTNLAVLLWHLQLRHPRRTSEMDQNVAYTFHMLDSGFSGAMKAVKEKEPMMKLMRRLFMLRTLSDAKNYFTEEMVVENIVEDYIFSFRLCEEETSGALDALISRMRRTGVLEGNARANVKLAKEMFGVP